MKQRPLHAFFGVALGLLFVSGLIGAVRQQSLAAHNGGALSPDRVAYYQQLLTKQLRTEPYLVAPREDTVYELVRVQFGPDATQAEIDAAVSEYFRNFYEENNRSSRPNPLARLGREKQLEIAQQNASGPASYMLTGTPEVLTVMMNFGLSETFDTDDEVLFQGACLTESAPATTITVDPQYFNQLAQPTDNWTPWLDPEESYTGGFTEEYVDLLMYSTTGYTQDMRTDLTNPWTGDPGFNFSGSSFRNWYVENSRGVYTPTGEVVSVTIPAAVSNFGAGSCDDVTDLTADDFYGVASRVAISAADQINIDNGSFDWTVWDVEDVFDYDNDGNFQEPDGYVDHFFLLEPGQAEGGEYGEFLIWPHSSDVAPGTLEGPALNQLGGHQVSGAGPLGGVWILNYTVSDEVGGLGVLVHEYGHDIGLPDNYSYDGVGSNTGFWDVMNSGNFGGGLSGMQPVHMTIWDKAEPYLGWNTPEVIDYNTTAAIGEANAITFTIGQQSLKPANTADGLRIVLPDLERIASVEPFDNYMWYSDVGDTRNESIARTITVTAGEDVTVTAQLAYAIEEDWDYMYWEISSTVTGGWVPLDVYSGTEELTTDTDPNDNNFTGNGITGIQLDWITAHAVITDAMLSAGQAQFRFRYFTDAAFQEEGIYLDNIVIDGSASGELFSDDAEGTDTWTHISTGISDSHPWFISDGVVLQPQSYLVEWRNSGEGTGFTGVPQAQAFATAGFDIGLNRMYWIDEFDEAGNVSHVDRFFNHTPGLLVWYANGRYEDNNIESHLFDDTPSLGAKGRVLLVDANPDPQYVLDEGGIRRVNERRSSFDAAFGLTDRPAFQVSSNIDSTPTDTLTTIPAGAYESTFHDRLGSAPGITGAPPNAAFIDAGAGVVLPTLGDVPYDPAWDAFGLLGNPGLNAFGINLEVVDQAEDGTWAVVKFWIDDDTVFMDQRANPPAVAAGGTTTVTISLKDGSGSRYEDGYQYQFPASLVAPLPEGAQVVSGSLSVEGSGVAYVINSADELAAYGVHATLTTASGPMILWIGTLGGNRIDVPDAIITYAAVLQAAGSVDEPTLCVQQQEIFDTFREGGDPFLWPQHMRYGDSSTLCGSAVWLPLIFHP